MAMKKKKIIKHHLLLCFNILVLVRLLQFLYCDFDLQGQKRHRLAATCGFYRLAASCQQVEASLPNSSTCSKSVKIRLGICRLAASS